MSSTQQLPRQFGKYMLVRKIAMGGMAEIFKAKTGGAEGFEKDVVIKRILPHFTEDADFVKMFIDEASITSKLQHANIVQIFDFDVSEGSYYIAMELIEGVDLKKVIDVGIKDGKPLSPAQCVNVLMETGKGLHYAHVKEHKGQPLNIVHRDISPHNVMVSYNGEVKLMDFGIAKAAQRSTKTMAGTVKGKVAYMSPEQARGKPLDGRSDLFALGIMLWEMLTGKRLFLGDSDFETLTNVLKTEAPAPSTLNPKVDSQLDAIVLKSLAKDRDQRHASVEEFVRDLTRWYYSNVQDLEAESLKAYLHDLFAVDIEQNRLMNLEEKGLAPAGAAAAAAAKSADVQGAATLVPPDEQNERTLALPAAADAGAPTLLDGSLSAVQVKKALDDSLRNRPTVNPEQNQATAVFDANAMGHLTAGATGGAGVAQGEAPKKSRAALWVLLALVVIGGGVGAALALGGGGSGESKDPTPVTVGEAPAAAPAVETADFLFTVEPPEAKVSVDGKPADGKVTGLELGKAVEVVAEAPGYVRYSEIVKLEDKATVRDIKLEKEREKVSLVLEPDGDENAEVLVGGKSLGKGAQLVNGLKGDVVKVEIRPSAEGAEPIVADVTLDGSQTVRKFKVGNAPANLTIVLDPKGSKVSASKGEVATAADGGQAIVSGLEVGDTVEVTVEMVGHTTRTENVALTGAEQTLTIALVKEKPASGGTRPGTNATTATGGKGRIAVRAKPWANVTLNGRPVGQTPKDIPIDAGTYTVVLSKGSQVVTKSVKVAGGKTTTVSHVFE
jgi:serine/threonine protein kinase